MSHKFQVSHQILLKVSQEKAFAFHADLNNIQKVMPAFFKVAVQKLTWPLKAGASAILQFKLLGILPLFEWQLEFRTWNPPDSFSDEQVGGAFKHFVHLHQFIPSQTEPDACLLKDTIEYSFCPLPWLEPIVDGVILKIALKLFLWAKLKATKAFL